MGHGKEQKQSSLNLNKIRCLCSDREKAIDGK